MNNPTRQEGREGGGKGSEGRGPLACWWYLDVLLNGVSFKGIVEVYLSFSDI